MCFEDQCVVQTFILRIAIDICTVHGCRIFPMTESEYDISFVSLGLTLVLPYFNLIVF